MPALRRVPVGDFRVGPREKKYLGQVIASNRISHGPFSRRFERAFAKAHDCAAAVFCNSGTSALHIALAALKERHGWKDGDEVIVPAVTFVATSNIVLHNYMTPVFVDVEPVTYNIDPALIERKITRRTRAIIPVHLLGLPADMDPIMRIARRHGLRVIEDSCETVFARYKGRRVGSFGDVACFSTYVAHYIVTGIGGLATTNDADLAVRLRSLMNHGRDSIYLNIDQGRGRSGKRLSEVVSRRFNFVSVGHSFRATEFEAALGLAQIERKTQLVAARQALAKRMTKGLADLQDVIQLPFVPSDREHVFMLYPIVVRNGSKRPLVDFLERRVLERRGVETRDLLPLINQPIYRKLFGDLEPKFPVARWLNRGGFYVGCHQYMSPRDADYIVEQIHAYFDRFER
jgi:perosamine synthetase